MRASKNMLGLTLLGLMAACATPAQMTTGPSVLGADGQVKVAEGPNGNTLVKIAIQHLAEPEKVSAGATVYVAWIQSGEGGSQQNVGQIQLNANREGMLETVTPFKAFTVTVTAEPTATAATPTGNPVLTTKIAAGQ
jgi:hypothetical protein